MPCMVLAVHHSLTQTAVKEKLNHTRNTRHTR
jgi:hypothetical protein